MQPSDRFAIEGSNGTKVVLLEVVRIYRYNEEETAKQLFGMIDQDYPVVAELLSMDPFLVRGLIKAFLDFLEMGPRH